METKSSSSQLRDILLVIFALAAIVVLVARAIYLIVLGYTSNSSSVDMQSNVYDATAMLFCVVLLIPMAILTFRHLRGHPLNLAHIPPVKFWQVAILIGAWIVVIVISLLLSKFAASLWAVNLPFFLLGIAIPIMILVWVALGGIQTGSWRRLWASLGISMAGSTLIALGLELLTIVLGAAVVGVFATFDPALKTAITQLTRAFRQTPNVQDLMPLLEPYLNNPFVFLAILVFVSGFGPLIEEAVKPLAVWLIGKRLHSPGEGFALGALCGAGFALLEGMLVSSGSTDAVGISSAARATSSLMHITASGLMGWGIASALLQKRYLRLAGTYLLSCTLHALWNGSVLLTVYGGLRIAVKPSNLDALGGITIALGVLLLGTLFIIILIALPLINHRFRSVEPAQQFNVPPPIPTSILPPPIPTNKE